MRSLTRPQQPAVSQRLMESRQEDNYYKLSLSAAATGLPFARSHTARIYIHICGRDENISQVEPGKALASKFFHYTALLLAIPFPLFLFPFLFPCCSMKAGPFLKRGNIEDLGMKQQV